MKIAELKERIDKIKLMLDDPEAGGYFWSMMFGQLMAELIDKWGKR